MPSTNLAYAEIRREDRDEVHVRARGVSGTGEPLRLLIVNISSHGLMARCEQPVAQGDRVTITLPIVGRKTGEVRWALGGRMGVQFEQAVGRASYYELIAHLLKAA